MANAAASDRLGFDVPADWSVVELGDLVESVKQMMDPRTVPEEEFKYYSIPAYQENGVPVDEVGGRIGSSKLVVDTGTVLFGKLNPRVPKVWYVEGVDNSKRKIASTEFIPLVANDDVDSGFLYYLCWSDQVMRKSRGLVSGSTPSRQRVDAKAFLRLPVVLPPLQEQRAIASALRAIQEAKDATEKVIAALHELRRSLLDHLLRFGPVPLDRAEGVELKATEAGMIPAQWRVRRLGDLASIGNGSTPKKSNDAYWVDGTIPWITSAKVHDGVIDSPTALVTETAIKECHLPLVPANSVVVAITGQGKTLGNAAIVAIDVRVSQHLAYIRLERDEVLAEFVLVFLKTQYPQLRAVANAGGSTKGALTCGFLRTHPMPWPPMIEQEQIVAMIRGVDARVAAERQRAKALAELFRSTLQELMTGQRRVATPEVVGG